MFTLFNIRTEKESITDEGLEGLGRHAPSWRCGLADNGVQVLESASLSFFDSTVARSMAVAKCLLLKQISDRDKKLLLERDSAGSARKHI